MTDIQDKVREIQQKVRETSIYIGRVPKQTKSGFMNLANADFEGDYGMCLKWLMDFREGILSNPNEILSARIDILAQEIVDIKNRLGSLVKEPKTIKRLNGKILKRRYEKDEQINPTSRA